MIPPPKVKALMVKGPALYLEIELVKRPVVAVMVVALNPLVISREPAKELEPVELPVKVPVKI